MAAIDRVCDLVMKGGITSGVVYPKVVEEVARRFHLVGIAGTSAGAIAASLAAAAEFRRRHGGRMAGFDELARLSEELESKGKLKSLFTPDKGTRKLFKKLEKSLQQGFGFGTIRRLGWTLGVRHKKSFGSLRTNFFGLCTGMANGNRQAGVEPLTEWLSRRIDEIAGKDGEPLTFRDLHEAPAPEVLRALVGGQPERSIDYRAVTTCITFSRPFELPFTTGIFAFDEEEWRQLFPGYVVDFLVRKGKEIDSDELKKDKKLPLTMPDLPVIVATRMSLSFPVLLSMVPLWAVNFREKDDSLQQVWFSDGGITSNFPIHRFDGIYPQWPTLGVTLASTGGSGEPDHPQLRDPEVPEDRRLIYLPDSQGSGVLDRRSPFKGESAIGDFVGFLKGVFNSAQTWHDNAFMKLPGFRDRAVEIWMQHGEGGLSLDMDPEVIRRLAERGRLAGELLADRFAAPGPGGPMSWDGHRWTRFRSGMVGLFETLLQLRQSIQAPPMAGERSLSDLYTSNDVPPTHKYRSNAKRNADLQAWQELIASLDRIAAMPTLPFQEGPRPPIDFGSRAPF